MLLGEHTLKVLLTLKVCTHFTTLHLWIFTTLFPFGKHRNSGRHKEEV